jgi:iron complex transport system ATP-binding protein
MTSTAVALSEVVVRVNGRSILGPIDLEIGRGERWVLLGPNGSGKTTLLGVAGGRRRPSRGRATILSRTLGEVDVRALWPRIAHQSHLLADAMPPGMTAEDTVLTGKRSMLVPWMETFTPADRERARALLIGLGCGHLLGRPLASASQGERQRVLLARSSFADPELLLLDEPCAGLDLPGREELIAAIDASSGDGDRPTLMMATHHLEEIPGTATHAALLRGGQLVAAGAIESVLVPGSLRACFGIDVDVRRDGGRWWASARRSDQDTFSA